MIIFNSTDSPVLIDKEGRTLGGNEHLDLGEDVPSVEILAAIQKGWLVITDEPTPPGDKSGDTIQENKPQRSNARSNPKKG